MSNFQGPTKTCIDYFLEVWTSKALITWLNTYGYYFVDHNICNNFLFNNDIFT